MCRPGVPRREHAGTGISAIEQNTGAPQQARCGQRQQTGGPPPLAGIGVHRLGPADGRCPGQGAAGDVTDGTRRERHRDEDTDHGISGAGSCEELCRHQRGSPEQQSTQGGAQAQGHRSRHGQAIGDEAGGDRCPHHRIGNDHRHCGRHRGGVPVNGSGAHQLVPAGFLLSACVAHDEHHAHQPGDNGSERAGLPGDLTTGGVQGTSGPRQSDEGWIVCHGRSSQIELPLRRVQPIDAPALGDEQQDVPDGPSSDVSSILSEVKSEQRAGSGRLCHGCFLMVAVAWRLSRSA